MYGLSRLAVSRTAVPVRTVLVRQSANLLSGPPRVPISKPEKLVSGIILSLGIVTPSAYILANVQNYRKRE